MPQAHPPAPQPALPPQFRTACHLGPRVSQPSLSRVGRTHPSLPLRSRAHASASPPSSRNGRARHAAFPGEISHTRRARQGRRRPIRRVPGPPPNPTSPPPPPEPPNPSRRPLTAPPRQGTPAPPRVRCSAASPPPQAAGGVPPGGQEHLRAPVADLDPCITFSANSTPSQPPDPDVAGPARRHSSTSSPGENLPRPLDLAHLFPRHSGHFCGRAPHAGERRRVEPPPVSHTPLWPFPSPAEALDGSRVLR